MFSRLIPPRSLPGGRELPTVGPSQNIKAPKLTNEKQEDEIYPKNRAAVEANFSLCRPPIKISTVQNEEQDVKNLQFKFHVDPTVKE
ncbi:uncharacterized protein DS421_16g529110 [Arachis hypogaea]|nr:uncharacterized protein DS421_16g529110 [Arachis hypogaea]